MTTYPTVKFADVVTLSRSHLPDPLTAGIERFVCLEHIEHPSPHGLRNTSTVGSTAVRTNKTSTP